MYNICRFIASYAHDITIYSITSGAIETTIPTNYTGIVAMSLKEVPLTNSLYIAMVSISGELIIYHMNIETGPTGQSYTNATKQHSSLSIVNREYCIPEKKINCGISWKPDSNSDSNTMLQLALPANTNSKWIEEMVVTTNTTLGHGSIDLTMVSYSPNGRYLLTSDIAGSVVCWKCSDVAMDYEVLRKWTTAPVNTKQLDDVQWGLDAGSNYMVLLAGSHYCKGG